MNSRLAHLRIPALLFVLALLPRLWALNWGLPYVEHPDEPALVEVVVRMVQNGDPNPHAFLYPSLTYYLLALTTRLYAWWGMMQGWYATLGDLPLETYLFTTAPGLYIWNRAVTALLGAATIPLLYLLGRHMFDSRSGLLAACTLLVASFHVEHSHYITTDVPSGLWVTLAMIGAWMVARHGSWNGYLVAGIGLGLAAGTKYNAGVVALAVVLAHGLHWQWQSYRRPFLRLLAAGMLSLLVFLLTTPFALLDWPNFVTGLFFHTAEYAKGWYGNFTGRWNVAGYANFFWNEGLLPAGCVLLLAGLPLLCRRFPQQVAVLLGAIIPTQLLLLSLASHFVRNLLPIFPLLLLLAAAGAVALADALANWLRQRRRTASTLQPVDTSQRWLHWGLQGGLALVLLLPQALDSAWLLSYWGKPHTLAAAAEQLRSLPRGMLAAVEMNPVQWSGDPAVHPVRWLASHPLDWYRARGYRYLLVNSEYYGPQERELYTQMLRDARIVVQYPERELGLQPGPGAALIDLGEHPSAIPFTPRPLEFGAQIALLGYEIAPGEPRPQITPLEGAAVHTLGPAEPLQINLYWRALLAPERDYTLFIHVINQQGERVTQRDLPLRYGDYPSSRWQAGELVIDRADLALPALPPGDYRLEFGLYDASSGSSLPVQGELAGPGPNPTLVTITIR